MIALNAKNKMKLVTGEFLEPTIESDLRAIWERKNDMLISWILNTDKYNALEAPYLHTCVFVLVIATMEGSMVKEIIGRD
ncbi:hypothetical protein Tco_1462017 [Tanacetum coccineum]